MNSAASMLDADVRPAAAVSIKAVDKLLASALASGPAPWPQQWSGGQGTTNLVLDRVTYHGVAGLLVESGGLAFWPSDVAAAIRSIAVAQSMWELRHRSVVASLIERFASAGVAALVLKGTAVAYDVYPNPAARARGDSDLLVQASALESARRALRDLGFAPMAEDHHLPEQLRSQESWLLTTADAAQHVIDLHWRPLNAPALDARFGPDEWFASSRALSGLSPSAKAPSRATMLLHGLVHRSMHDCAPYYVGSQAYFGGNRLIWLTDIRLLGRALTKGEWSQFAEAARGKGVADACLAGIAATESRLGSFCPADVRVQLTRSRSSIYFRSNQLTRAVLDTLAIPGVRQKWRYVQARTLPGARFLRGKYPQLSRTPLPLLYARRFVELLRARP